MSDSRSFGVGRVSHSRRSSESDQVDAAERAVRPPPRRKPKRKFEMEDERKAAPMPDKKVAAGSEKKKGPSLFELSAKKGDRSGEVMSNTKSTRQKGEFGSEEEAEALAADDEAAEKSALAQLNAMAAAKKGRAASRHLVEERDGSSRRHAKSDAAEELKSRAGQIASEKEGRLALQLEERQDMGIGISGSQRAAAVPKADMEALIKQIAKHMSQMQSSDRNETTVTIKHPPLFEGAKITMTEYHTAKGEFNLKFSNLSNQAQLLVDQMQNQDALRQGLEAKGFAVHIITSTREDEPIVSAESQQSREQHQGDSEGEEKGGDQNQADEEKEGWA